MFSSPFKFLISIEPTGLNPLPLALGLTLRWQVIIRLDILLPPIDLGLLLIQLLSPVNGVVFVSNNVELLRFLVQEPAIVHSVLYHLLLLILLFDVPLLVLVLDYVLQLVFTPLLLLFLV